jgi:hypothetical protein
MMRMKRMIIEIENKMRYFFVRTEYGKRFIFLTPIFGFWAEAVLDMVPYAP